MPFSLRNIFLKEPQKVTAPSASEYLKSRSIELQSGARSFDFAHPELCSTIYTAVGLIANNVAKLDLHVYRKTEKGKEIYKDHPWEQTLSINPDLRLSTSKWINYTVTKLLLEGACYYYVSEFDDELILKKELKAVDCLTRVVQYEDDIWYKFEGLENWIPSKRLLVFHYFSKDGITGISPIAALRNELQIQSGAEQTISNFYKNGLFQLLYIEADLEGIGNADRNKLQEYFDKIESELAGSANAFKNGLLKVPPMYKLKSLSLPDLKFLESSKFTETRIAAIFNCPAWMLNIENSGGNYSKVEAQQLHFLNNCLSNIINILRQELQYKILSPEEIKAGITIDFDYSTLYTLDLESKSLYLKNLSSMGAISPNEVREAFGMTRDENEFMNMHFIQSQNQVIEKYDQWGNNKISAPNDQPE